MRLERVLIDIAAATTAPDVAGLVVYAISKEAAVLARVWLASTDGLELAGSLGTPTGGGSYSRLDGSFRRVRLGEGKIGQIAATRSSLVVPTLRGDEEWLANPAWIARQGVRAFVGHPLMAHDEVFGVLAVFDRVRPTAETLATWEFLARFAGTRLAQIRERDALLARVHALDSAASASDPLNAGATPPERTEPRSITTRAELRVLERETLVAALTQTSGRIFGPRGAALLLGMKPTTLASRLKALGIPPARAIRRNLKAVPMSPE